MEFEEAKKIAEVLASVDNYCLLCSREAADKMAEKFPQFDWVLLVSSSQERGHV